MGFARQIGWASALVLVLSSQLQSQQVINRPPPELAALLEAQGGVMMSPAVVSADAVAGEAGAEPSLRLAKLKALTYDRRPSAILEAWSAPALEVLPMPEDPADDEAADAEPADADDTTVVGETTDADAETLVEPIVNGTIEVIDRALDALELAELAEAVELDPEVVAAQAAEAAATAEAAAEAAAEEARLEAERQEAITASIDRELEILQRNVTLGAWDAVGSYLSELDEEDALAAYAQMLKSLSAGPPRVQSPFAKYAEKNSYSPDDLAGLIAVVPAEFELEDEHKTQLGKILTTCVAGGSLIEQVIERLGVGRESGELSVDDNLLARLLVEAKFPVEAGAFLPEPAVAIEADDREALNLLSRHYLARESEDSEAGFLVQAWEVLQAVLADGEVEDDQKNEAIKRAVALAPRIRDELGQAWLEESFTDRPQRGMEILRAIGAAVAKGLVDSAKDKDLRLTGLQLQSTAADALLLAAPELAGEWSDTLSLLAGNWLQEARFSYAKDTSTSRGPALERDVYGNFFYHNYRNQRSGNQPDPILTGDILDVRPAEAWLAHVDGALKPSLDKVSAQLLLKIREEDDAFPYIEALAQTHPEQAEELVDEFLEVWAENHDPNANNNRRSNYIYFFGFEQRANAIPLTRSKQERNLTELAGWVERLRALPIKALDEKLLANCFTRAHSTAEVYRLETIESVFGSMQSLEPETLAELVQRMRANLVGVWRQPNTQKEAKTRRRQKDIQSEVLRGYSVARSVVERGLVDHPQSWELRLALAAILHDENNYNQEIATDSSFAGSRQSAFDVFARAARDYAAGLPDQVEEERTAEPYLIWFYASLGACDLGKVDSEQQPVASEVAHIRDAIMALPESEADEHLALFANTLFTRMSNVNPAVKFSYVRHGLQVVGDHERALDAKDVYEYYSDLVTEIQLDARVDGSADVGHGEPFGLIVDLRHTREIEREAGGFAKYLTNQNNSPFAYNYGRPTENYRDKFEESARKALGEHFTVHSVTFNHPEVHSLAEPEYGWRVTPYAYILLSATGPEVDRVPSLHLDLDFLDTTGYAVLPVESSPLVIDASLTSPGPRPFSDLQVVQTLDERQAADGKLLLEVQTSAKGLVPDLDEFLDVVSAGFEIESVDDQGVAVSQFEEDGEGRSVQSERLFVVSLRAKEELEQLPERFSFAAAKIEIDELTYQRYDDADLVSVEPEIALLASYGELGEGDLWPWLAALLVLVGGAAWLLPRWLRRDRLVSVGRYTLPSDLSPFSVIELLRRMVADGHLPASERPELQGHIDTLEAWFFADVRGGETPDAAQIARTWVQRLA
jgi:hypothetical protein